MRQFLYAIAMTQTPIYQKLVKLPFKLERAAPPFEDNSIKCPESMIRHILKAYSKKGDTVFDPFAGMGTTMFVAEEMGRVPFGIEYEAEKYEWVAGQIENWTHMIHDSAANVGRYDLPKMDLILTCPPYMMRQEKWNPLFGGNPAKAGYEHYLKEMRRIFSKMLPMLKSTGRMVVQVDNIQYRKFFTPLIKDIGDCLTRDYLQIDQVTIVWENPKPDYPATQYLVFQKRK